MHDRRQLGLVFYRAATDVVAKGAMFLVTVAAARELSRSAFGLFSLASTVGWMVAVAADFGLQMHLARAIAQQPTDAAMLLRRWLPVRLLTAVVGMVAVGVGGALMLDSWQAALVLFLFTTVYACNGLLEFVFHFYRGLGRSDIESSFVGAQRLAMLLLALPVLRWRPSLVWLAAALLLPAIVALALGLRLAARAPLADAEIPERHGGVSGDVVAHVLPIGAGIVLSALYFRIDLFLLAAWRGAEAAGAYNAVFRIIEALRLLPAAALAVATPTLFAANSRRPLRQLATTMTLGALFVTAVLWTTSGWLVPAVFGAAYAEAGPVLRVLALSFPLMTLNYALTYQLIGWHGHRLYASVCAAALVVNVVANALAIPRFGAIGAAWTTCATELAVTVLCLLALSSVERSLTKRSPLMVALS